jgi:hypothetical protein
VYVCFIAALVPQIDCLHEQQQHKIGKLQEVGQGLLQYAAHLEQVGGWSGPLAFHRPMRVLSYTPLLQGGVIATCRFNMPTVHA